LLDSLLQETRTNQLNLYQGLGREINVSQCSQLDIEATDKFEDCGERAE